MNGISTITKVVRDQNRQENEKDLSSEEIFARRMSRISEFFPMAEDHDISWLVSNDKCFGKLMNVIEQVKQENAFVDLDENHRIKRRAIFPVLKGICLACQAVENVVSGKARHAVCITKAEQGVEREEEEAGHAILSNAAIAAHYALNKNLIRRVAVVDLDLGHEAGTREVVGDNPDILLLSVNSAGMGGGSAGQGAENFRSVTIPKIAHQADIEKIFAEKVFAEIEKFNPDMILMATAPSEDTKIWPEGFKCGYVNKGLMELAEKSAKGRYILVLEGSVDEEAFLQCQTLFDLTHSHDDPK